MFITCQKEMDFREEHNAAINGRLRKFHFKTLRSPTVFGAMEVFKEQTMDCIVWASCMAMPPDDELPPPVPKVASVHSIFDNEERERIRNLTMDESDSGDAMVDDASLKMPAQSRESGKESDGTSDDGSSYAKELERSYEEIVRLSELQLRNSLKWRQLDLLGTYECCGV